MTLDERNQKVNDALSEKFDALNAVFEKHERKLREMRAAHDVEVVFQNSKDTDRETGVELGEHFWCLGFRKHEGKWRLCYRKFHVDFTDGYSETGAYWKPIVECMVEDRVRAAPHIGLLREEIVKSKEDFAPKVDQAIYELEQALSIYDE